MKHEGPTFINQIREILKRYKPDVDKFTTLDLIPLLPRDRRPMIPGTMRGLEIMGEVVKTGATKPGPGGRINIWMVPSVIVRTKYGKLVKHSNKPAQKPAKKPKLIVETKTKDVWAEIWPELYRLPAHMIRNPDKPFNRIVHHTE